MSNPQSILNKSQANKSSQKIVWDEDKLKKNEQQTQGQVFMKIDEPKTPFVRFEQTDLEGLDDLSLGDSVEKPVSVAEPTEWDEQSKGKWIIYQQKALD
ncbi:hypothetical protein EDC96DRAFT_579055 [Choanephora cucurbitarum]|nr:hypothetical protein EDC96DRAFT_579055 [Choanephora cucurbitarum]